MKIFEKSTANAPATNGLFEGEKEAEAHYILRIGILCADRTL
jgi:hypothetical protein